MTELERDEGAVTDLVGGDEVADKQEDAHDDVLSNGDDVGAGDLEDLDATGSSSVEVDVVGADTGGDTDLQVLRLNMARSVKMIEHELPCLSVPSQ